MLRGNIQKGSADLYLLVVAGLVFPETGAAIGTATRGDTAFGQAVAEFPDWAQPAQRLVWQRNYSDPAVGDGTGWSAEIVYSDRSLVSSGGNCFPGRDGGALAIGVHERDNTFENFCRAVGRLIGREFH
jgi:hypothetical protein